MGSAVLSVSALEAPIVGPRALGMGGTGVATATDNTAQFYNPALFGFFGQGGDSDNQGLVNKYWGMGFDLSAGVRVHGNLLELAQQIADLDINELSTNGITSANQVQQLVRAGTAFSSIGNNGNFVSAEANMGLATRIGHFGIGVRIYGEAASFVSNTDLLNVALSIGGIALANQINATGSPTDGQVLAFSPTQSNTLTTAFGGGANALLAVQRLDYQLRLAGASQSQIDNTFTMLENAANQTGLTISDNNTLVRLNGFAMGEIPLTFGTPLNEHIAIGGSVKLMIGRVYGSEISVFEEDAPSRLDEAGKNYHQSANVGVDLGVAVRFPWWQAGITGRNLNRPTFKGFTDQFGVRFEDVRVDPQVAVGVAFIPWSWLTFAVDGDLTPSQSPFNGYQTQRVGGGIEINPFHILALRAGYYQNIAEEDVGPIFTLGAGINLYAIRIDLAGAASTDLTEIQGYEIPDEFRVSLQISSDF